MTRGRTSARLVLGLSIALAIGLGACGKRGAPKVPEGQEDVYVYPRFYPPPGKEPPIFGSTPAAAEPAAEEKRKPKRKLPAAGKKRPERFSDEPAVDPLSSDDNTIGTYETSPE